MERFKKTFGTSATAFQVKANVRVSCDSAVITDTKKLNI